MIEFEDLIGKPFKIGGKGDSYDCWTLAQEVCGRVGIVIPDKESIVNVRKRSETIVSALALECVKLEKPEPFCIVAFKIKPPFVNHIGVMVNEHEFIHIMKKCLTVIEEIRDIRWKTKIEGFYRYVGGK